MKKDNTRLEHIITLTDQTVFNWLFSKTRHTNIQWIKWLSKSGDGYFYIVLSCFLALLENEGFWFLTAGLTAFMFELPSYFILKNTFKRSRPSDVLVLAHIKPSDKFSLPSGHTAAAFVMATITSYFYPSFTLIAYSWAGLIGISRILLGVHYPTDIIAGAFLGGLSAWLSLSLLM